MLNSETTMALALTPKDLARLGMEQVAYIRGSVVGEAPIWSIYDAAGTQVGEAQTREQALSTILEHGLTPLYVN